jgi:WS/DGAT/MGAT family acyltransferase
LPRTRPLWELTIVDDLAQKRVALVFKVHHAAVDGVSCLAILARLLDADPGSGPDPQPQPQIPEPGEGEPDPNAVDLFANEVAQWPRRLRLARDVLDRGAHAAADSVLRRINGDAEPPHARPFEAARTRFNRKLSARRVVAISSARRADIAFVKDAYEATSNDVVLAACTASLRNYLEGHGGIPDRPLVAAIPCALRRPGEDNAYGNQISAFLVHLPVHLEDPVDRLLSIRNETRTARAENGRVAGSHLTDWAELAPPGLLSLGSALIGNARVTRSIPPICNLVISNVPGPQAELSIAGAKVKACYPHGPLIPGVGLNLTVMSHGDSVSFGLLACKRAVPDAGDIALGFEAAIGGLIKRAVAGRGSDSPKRARVRPGAAGAVGQGGEKTA